MNDLDKVLNRLSETDQVVEGMCTLDRMKEELDKFTQNFLNTHANFVTKLDLKNQVDRFIHEVQQISKIREVDRNSIQKLTEDVSNISLTLPKLMRQDDANIAFNAVKVHDYDFNL